MSDPGVVLSSNPIIEWMTVPCITVKQPIGTFYIAAIDSKYLREICWNDIRKIERGERDIEIISGIQRPLVPKRQKEIAKYVKTVDASFPTAIIIAVSSRDAEYDSESHTMRIRYGQNVARVIDGQHRIEGLKNFTGSFELNVAIFVDLETQDQAMLFSTINVKQTKVSRSLALDLFEYATTRSPQKTTHDIARVADTRAESPFLGRIKILGTAFDKDKEIITQAGFAEPLMEMITTDAMADRDALKRRFGKIEKPTDAQIRAKNLIFRTQFIEGKDEEIARTLLNYFNAVKKRWPIAWETNKSGFILARTSGYRAFMSFLPYVMFKLGLNRVIPIHEFSVIFDSVKLADSDFTSEKFKPGSSGEALLRQTLINQTGINEKEAWKTS